MTFWAAPPVLPAPLRKKMLPEPPTGVPCAAAGPTAVARMPAVRPAVRKPTARLRLVLMEWNPHRSRPVLGDWQKVSSQRSPHKLVPGLSLHVSGRFHGASCAHRPPAID